MGWKGRDIIAIRDFSKAELFDVLDAAQQFEVNTEPILQGKVLASCFFEPSTRTRLSFEAAMHKLGGRVIGFSEAASTSQAKGESLHDTIKVIGSYADVLVMRHPQAGAAKIAADASSVPVINAGDGPNEHPTQTFVDLYTIRKLKGKFDGLNIGFIGDLKYGRTVHSLARALKNFKVNLFFISPQSLAMPEELISELAGINLIQTPDLQKVLPQLDILYATRIQKERFPTLQDYNTVRHSYCLDRNILLKAKPELRIMHPLPRVDELHPELDQLQHAVYFEQAANGIPVRQALLSLVIGKV